MMTNNKSLGNFDLIVVGGGHAGGEAALAGARLGCRTAIFCLNLDFIAQMSCNPAIGGIGKSHLVREIDALGGEMAKVADKTAIQLRTLNTRKGPAVQALRAQSDKVKYRLLFRQILENTPNLILKQEQIDEILTENNQVVGIRTDLGITYTCKALVLATGTFLNGLLHTGMKQQLGGRLGEPGPGAISESLKKLGFQLGRLKTGTNPRVDGRTVDFTHLAVQKGDPISPGFSFSSDLLKGDLKDCYLGYTNEKTHQIILGNLDQSPLFQGKIKGRGPRYCPSIEDKVFRFRDIPRHQIFLEPEGEQTCEFYLNGLSTSLPYEVQVDFLHTIEGLQECQIMRPGYAVEYDFVFPTQLKPTLETKIIRNLYLAGQINGTSGYEEAAAQGLIAGINAALRIQGKPELVIDRSQAYIGVMIDDLICKGVNEPYRMFTSRSENRLSLRQDNADLRLSELGWQVGLLSQAAYERFLEKKRTLENEMISLQNWKIKPEDFPTKSNASTITSIPAEPITAAQILKRPEITYEFLKELAPEKAQASPIIASLVETEIKYEGYIAVEKAQAERMKTLSSLAIPENINYDNILSLSTEVREHLKAIRPTTLGQASRMEGITPAAIAALANYLKNRDS